jgi:hypothetical protein
LTITPAAFSYDVSAPFHSNVTFFSSDTEFARVYLGVDNIITAVSIWKDRPYVTDDLLKLNVPYAMYLQKEGVPFHASLTIKSYPFSYDVNTIFYTKVTFTNSDQSNAISIMIRTGSDIRLDAKITNSHPWVSTNFTLGQDCIAELTKGYKIIKLK